MADDKKDKFAQLSGTKSRLKEVEEQLQSVLKWEKELNIVTEEGNALQKEKAKLIDRVKRLNKDILATQRKTLADGLTDFGSLSTMYGKLNKSEQERIAAMDEGAGLSKVAIARANNLATINYKISQLTAEDSLERKVLNDEYKSELKALKGQSGISDKIIKSIEKQNGLANDYGSIQKNVKEQLDAQTEGYDKIKKLIGGILGTFSILTSGPAGALGVTLMGAGKAADYIGANVRDWGGYIGGAQASAMGLGLIFKDASGTAKSLSSEFGGLRDITMGTQFNTNLMALNMGITGDEAAKTLGSFARLNNGSTDMAANLAESTKELAKQNHLVPSAVMKDVANSTKAFAEYGKNGGKNIAEAAVAAGKLGVNMDTLTRVTDHLLDFESSINDELELGAMLGKNINLNNARSLAYNGQIGDAVKDTLQQLGGIDAFNKMDIFQKRKAAQLLGLSVEEFQKMAANSDKHNSDGTLQVSQFDRIKESVTGIATGMGGMLKTAGGLVLGLAQMGGSLSQMGLQVPGLTKLFSKMPGVKAGGGANPAAAATPKPPDNAPQVDNANKFGKIKSEDLIKGAAAILILAAALWVSAKAFQEFASVKWEDVGKGLVGMLGLVGIAYLLSKVEGDMIQGAVAIAILGAALIPFAFALSLLGNVKMENVLAAAAGLVIFTAAIFGLGALMMTGVGALVFGAGVLALIAMGAAMMILGAGLIVAANGFNAISSVLPNIVDNVSQLSKIEFGPILGLAGSLMVLAGALAAVGVAGLLALPVLIGLNKIGLVGEGGGGAKQDKTDELIGEIKALRADMQSGKIGVYLDGHKVSAAIGKTVEKSGTNNYGHK